MKHVQYFTKGLLMAGFCLVLGACSNDDFLELEPNITQSETITHTIAMEFIGDVVGFDQQSNAAKVQTRAASSSWNDGDKIYITFYNESNIVPGEATYNSSSGWSVSYDGYLGTGTNLKCEARYFVNTTFQNSSLVTLNPNTEIYEDLNGTYAYSNGSLTVQASLTPKTGRIRFTGTPDAKIYTTGISVYTTFSPAINQFSTSNAMITSTVTSNGSTPYIYGSFSDSDRNIGLVGADFAYTRTCTSDMLKVGESGYMAIPSESSHNNWRSGLYVKASGVEFKMIPVAGLSSGFFMIGETEVTEQLYKTMTGTSSSSTLPIRGINYSEALSFIEKLNNNTKLNFDLPTKEEWLYAAKGGAQSQGYTYCGSNTPGDVAWYAANTSNVQNVKTKAPNELGIYDMSGNVSEFVKKYGAYKPSSTSYYACYWAYYGGNYKSSTEDITKTSNKYYYNYSGSYGYGSATDALADTYYDHFFDSNSNNTIGIRLKLICK